MHATGNHIENITGNGIYFESGGQFLLDLTKSGIPAKNSKVSDLAIPTSESDPATKKYVDDNSSFNVTENFKLNSHQLWFNTTNASRINSIQNSVEIVASAGIFLKLGNTALLSAQTAQISVHDKQLKHLAVPTEDNDAATKNM